MPKLNGWAGKALGGLMVLAAVGLVGATISNTVTLASIQSSQFTADDGLMVWQAIADIRADMAAMPQEAPPLWFIQRVDKIDIQITRVHERLDKIEDEIARQ